MVAFMLLLKVEVLTIVRIVTVTPSSDKDG